MLTISQIKKRFLQSESVTDLQPKIYIHRPFNISCQLVYGGHGDNQPPPVVVEAANITAVIYDESLRKHKTIKGPFYRALYVIRPFITVAVNNIDNILVCILILKGKLLYCSPHKGGGDPRSRFLV